MLGLKLNHVSKRGPRIVAQAMAAFYHYLFRLSWKEAVAINEMLAQDR